MESSLEAKVAIITGAGRGIGAACATELARAGAAVVPACAVKKPWFRSRGGSVVFMY